MQTLDVRGRPMAYLDAGRRAPLLLVHAFPLDHALWGPQVDAFGPQRRVIVPDLAGFGASPGGHDSLDEHADDLAALLDALGVRRAVVAGLSMGGYVAFAFWRRHRDRVAALVLADTRATPDTEAARAGRYQTAGAVAEQGVSVLVGPMLPNLLGPEPRPATRAEVQAMMARQPAAGVVAALKAMAARPDSTADLAGIDVPTLVVVGGEDRITPPDDARAIAAAVPGAGLVVVPGAGHLSNLEEPGAFNAALRAFLETVDGAGEA